MSAATGEKRMTAPAALLDRFDGLSLDELNTRAELQTRVDRKYILPAAGLATVLADLADDTLVLEIDGARGTPYESVYFDTPELASYHLAARGRRRRFKIRTRHYLGSGASFLEVKTRGGRSLTVKERFPYAVDAAGEALRPEGVAYADDLLRDCGVLREGGALDPRMTEQLYPTLITRYRRTTLLLPAESGRNESRATIDDRLEWVDVGAHDFARDLHLPRSVIVETKSGSSAGDLDRALWRHGHRPATLSKFGTGLAALRPGLPANKWRRVLDRHFTTR